MISIFPRVRSCFGSPFRAARKIAALRSRLGKRGIPTIYVNDNFGRWRSDFKSQVERCTADDSLGSEVAKMLLPDQEDYFVLKPKHSGFFSTSLDILLSYLGARRLIIAGFAADICVLFTANDAYMRDYELMIPIDCTASESASARQRTCRHMKRFLRADIRPTTTIRIRRIQKR
jgi:nicotinamidase-related amidase